MILNNKPLIQHTLENIEKIEDNPVEKVFVVTNNKYFDDFDRWRKNYEFKVQIQIINDKTNSNEERLGAVGDLLLVLEQQAIGEDVLVISGDNLLAFELSELLDFFNKKNSM